MADSMQEMLIQLQKKQQQYQRQLTHLEENIDKLEQGCLKKWNGGNIIISFDLAVSQMQRKHIVKVPPEAKIFSTSSTTSHAFKQLGYRYKIMRPNQYEPFQKKHKFKCNEFASTVNSQKDSQRTNP